MPAKVDEDSLTEIVGGPVSKQSARSQAVNIIGAARHWNRDPTLALKNHGNMFWLCQWVGNAVKSNDGAVFEAVANILRGGLKQEEFIMISLKTFLVNNFPNVVVKADKLADYVIKEFEAMGMKSPDESTIRKVAKRIGIPTLPPGRPRKPAKNRRGRRV